MNPIQFFIEGISLSFGALWSNKLRTFLTMVGVATGIFAITSILTMTYSMQYSVTANLSALGNTTMFVHNWPWKDNSEDWFKFFNRPKVSYKDYEVLHKNLKEVVGVAYNASIMGQSVKTEGRSLTGVAVQAVTEDYGKIGEWNFAEGRYFSDWEIGAGSPVCVLGYNLGQSLFPNEKSIIGKWVRVSGRKLKVIGIRSKQGSGMFGPTPDDQLFIPYLLATKEFDLSRRSVDKVITLKAVNYEKVDYVESEAIGLIRAARGLKPSIENNFSINKQEMLMKQIDGFFGYMEKSGIVIAAFSLLIGAFSIGNIMYISVKERTNEIGIQKALGSTQSFILFQFLTESIVICILGGLLGILILLVAVQAAEYAVKSMDIALQIVVSQGTVLNAVFLSILIGLFAGIIPAFLAARVDPVIAIRAS